MWCGDPVRLTKRGVWVSSSKRIGAGAKGVPFVPSGDSYSGRAVALPSAFVAVAFGLLASAAALSAGYGWLVALLAYICVGGVAFVLFGFVIYLLLDDEDGESLPISPSRGRSPHRMGVADVAQPQWAQRSPVGPQIDDGRIFHIGSTRPGGLGVALAESIASKGYHVDICDDLHAALASITWSPLRWTLLIVDFDDCERYVDLNEIVDDLTDFRIDIPHVPVIALSSGFARDDFGLERLSIADYSLRLPAEPATIMKSVPIARANNLIWRARVRDMIDAFRAGEDFKAATHPQARGLQ